VKSAMIEAIVIDGLKKHVRNAFEAGKFMTDGRALPQVDFDRPIEFEVTAVDSIGLYPTLLCEDDAVVEHGRQFRRYMHLKMVPGCAQQDGIMKLITSDGRLALEFEKARHVRVCLKRYSVLNA
jgi:hypothetical protein